MLIMHIEIATVNIGTGCQRKSANALEPGYGESCALRLKYMR